MSKRELQIQVVDMNTCVSEVVNLVKSELTRRHVQLHTDCHVAGATVHGDAVHLQHAILNLIVNGMDAMKENPESERNLFVSTAANVDGYVEVSITDTGHGIEAENLSRVFESFYTTKPDGMGMGLYLARLIVQSHAGRLWAENNKNGKGTTLRFILPTIPTEAPKPSPLKEASTYPAAAREVEENVWQPQGEFCFHFEQRSLVNIYLMGNRLALTVKEILDEQIARENSLIKGYFCSPVSR